jgi:hypothetical protein
VLLPKLTAGLYFGSGVGHVAGEPLVALFSGGVHLALTRLEPSGWWFPVFFDLGLEAPWGAAPAWRFAFGVGI